MTRPLRQLMIAFLTAIVWLPAVNPAAAHHVLGRPAYSLNEDSNTPPSLQAEVRVGGYIVTYSLYPDFQKHEQPGRISLYASRINDGSPFQGKVAFRARPDTWFSWLGIGVNGKKLGDQPADDNVFRQGYVFHEAGDYIIAAEFQVNGEPYIVEFPLRIGDPAPVGPIGLAVGAVLIVLLSISVIQRRRSMTGKIRTAHENKEQPS